MDLDEAKALMQACSEINSHLNNLSQVVDSIDDVEIQRAMRTELGKAVVAIYGGLMRPVIRTYPELDPDEG